MIHDLGVHEHDQEGRTLTLEFNNFVIVAVYTPNSGFDLKKLKYRVEQWDVEFRKHIIKLRETTQKPVIVAGDLNVSHQPIDICEPEL